MNKGKREKRNKKQEKRKKSETSIFSFLVSRFSFLFFPLFILACTQQAPTQARPPDIRTIENTPIAALPVQPPPTIDQTAAPEIAASETTGTAPSRQDELSRKMNLPFAPAIGMDPVDGSKISIGPDTPITEYKNRLFYFSSVKNKQAFIANPDAYLKEKLSTF